MNMKRIQNKKPNSLLTTWTDERVKYIKAETGVEDKTLLSFRNNIERSVVFN